MGEPEHWYPIAALILAALHLGGDPMTDQPERPEHRAARSRTDAEQKALDPDTRAEVLDRLRRSSQPHQPRTEAR